MTADAIALDPVPRTPGWCAVLRRACECLLAGIVIVVFVPLLLVVAVAITIDSPGPILFRQRRLGVHQRPFTLYKFRTMASDVDHGLHREYVTRLIAGDEEPRTSGNGTVFKAPMTEHVTRVGRVLRRWSIDELPQLWNVLRGEMAVIGPRPVIPYEAAAFPPYWKQRFAVKPGLTGLWQVSGRNKLTYHEMVELDLEYVRRRSLRLDAAILARTVPTVLSRHGV